MSYNNKERPNISALMKMFVALNELCKYYPIDHAIDVLDIYFKTGDPIYLPSPNNFRSSIVNSNIREYMLPIYEENDHLYNYLDEITPQKKLKK